MLALVAELSKYVFPFLMAFYVLAAFGGTLLKSEKYVNIIFRIQIIILMINQVFAYLVLYINSSDIRYIFMLLGTTVFLPMVSLLYYLIYPKSSHILVNNMCMLLSVGFIIISRLNMDKGIKQFVIAVAATVLTLIIPALLKHFKGFRNLGMVYCFCGIALLILVLLGNKVFGAKLVLTIGGVSVQPAEFVKILFVMFVAAMFNKSSSFRSVILVSFLSAVHVIILVLSTDLGTALIFFVVYIFMLYAATGNLGYILAGVISGSAASVAAYRMFSHVRVRVLVWLDPFKYIDDYGYQICQSLFAIGMGSWIGCGLLKGLPGKIPVAEKDFIFSAITEEFGLVFSVLLLLLCLNNLIIMMNIASKCNIVFYRLVALGLGVSYGFQVFLTVGGAIKLIPLTGVTLPFLSYGGSSLLSSLAMFALINGMYVMRSEEVDEKTRKSRKKQKNSRN